MKIGKVLALSAVSGIMMAVAGCGGDKAAAQPAADPASTTSGDKASCGGKGGCGAKGAPAGSATPAGSAAPAEKSACGGKGGCGSKGTTPPAPKAN